MPDTATTDMFGKRAVDNDTTVVPQNNNSPVGQLLPLVASQDGSPPPPVVIPPKKKQQRSDKSRGRRRVIIGIILMLLLGAAAGYGGWWFASGRYSHVPKVIGSLKADAIQKLEDAGYDVSVAPGLEFDSAVAKNHVLRTDPPADTRLVRGKTVTVVISAGPQYFTVPPVRGKTPAQARATLQGAGPLTVAPNVKPEASADVPEGKATRTVPAAGARVTVDRTITIYVSTGPPIIDVPSIAAGTQFGQAKRTLKSSAGEFKVHKIEQYSDSIPAGQVISIDPSDQARKFSTISVTVSKGPEFVQVPNIAPGTSLSDAEAALQNVGLTWTVSYPYGRRPGPVVLGTDPGAGTSVHVGDSVTLVAF